MTRSLLAGVLGLLAIAAVAALVTARQPAGDEADGVVFTPPRRTAVAPPAAPAVPPVPPAAETLTPISFTLATAWTGGPARQRTIEQRVTRAAHRVHLMVDDGRREWLFERNLVYADRVSGFLVDHAARKILVHADSDLRSRLGIRGWADVLTMRFDPASLAGLRKTTERRVLDGVAFDRFEARDSTATGVAEVWWSAELLLPLTLRTRESKTVTATARVLNLSRTVDGSLLEDPARRFPTYELTDVSDAGEDH